MLLLTLQIDICRPSLPTENTASSPARQHTFSARTNPLLGRSLLTKHILYRYVLADILNSKAHKLTALQSPSKGLKPAAQDATVHGPESHLLVLNSEYTLAKLIR
jgi:hypothetical protein